MSGLKLDGKPLIVTTVSPAVLKVRDMLDSSPADEVFSSGEMERKGHNGRTLDRFVSTFPQYTRRWKGKRYYGSPAAMEAFDKEIA